MRTSWVNTKFNKYWLPIAGVVLVLILLGVWFLTVKNPTPKDPTDLPSTQSIKQKIFTQEEKGPSPIGPGVESLGLAEVEERVMLGPPALPLSLVGTAVATDSRWSSATLVDLTTGENRVYRVGDWVPGKAKLVKIFQDRVLFIREGKKEWLSIQKKAWNPSQIDFQDYEEKQSKVDGGQNFEASDFSPQEH